MTPSLDLPGVYLDRQAPSASPGLETGVPVFLGYAPARRVDGTDAPAWGEAAMKLTSWSQLAQAGAPPRADGFLADAVRGFFENGGTQCYVLPLDETVRFTDAVESALRIVNGTDRVDLVCLPDAALFPDDAMAAQKLVLESAGAGHRMAILDPLPDRDLEKTVEQWQLLRGTSNSARNGALYFPWAGVRRSDGATRWVPPCGHVAGIIARTDRQAGVHKPPANEPVEGIADLQANVTRGELLRHDPYGVVNCLRAFPARGIRVWGARTTSAEPDWRYLNVRRLVLTMARWFELAMADVVMEPNGPPLWARVRREVNDYLFKLFSAGALRGDTPNDAYFIFCDGQTTPADARERGELWVRVGIAPVVPGEFIVVRLVQGAGGVQVDPAGDDRPN